MTTEFLDKKQTETEALDLPRSTGEDSLSHYIRQINAIPLLSVDEERDFFARWKKSEDRVAVSKLLTAHLKLVVKIASLYRRYGLPMEDLIAQGSVGLMKSLKNFNPDLGNRFSTYAMWWIKAEIKEYILHNWSLVKIGTTREQKQLFFTLGKEKRKLQSEKENFGFMDDADLHALAEQLSVSSHSITSMSARMGNRDFSLNATVGNPEEDESEWQDFLVDESQNQEEQLMEQDELTKHKILLEKAMADLSEREYDILSQRRMVDHPVTLESLGERYGLSRERVRQIETKAFEKIQAIVLKSASHITRARI